MAETKAVQRKADLLPGPIISLVQSLVPDCNALLPPDITTEQFRAALWLELTGRPALHACYPESLRECVVKAATYGMLPGRDAHFLPFGEKGRKERKATFVPNYFGMLRALYRTGMVEQAFAEVVFTNDSFDLDYGRPQPLVHKPPRKNRGVGEGAYGYIQIKGMSRPLVHYMDPDDLDRVRRRAPAHDQGPWVSDPNEMKRKTAMKNAAKYAPLTPLVQAMLEDEEARLLEDIPAERHHQNIIDLFGEGGGSPNAPRGSGVPPPETPSPWRDDCHTAGHSPEECPSSTRTQGVVTTSPLGASTASSSAGEHTSAPPRGQKRASSEEPGWKQTLRAHRDTLGQMVVGGVYTSDARARLDALLEQIDFALSPLGTVGETGGENLAAAVLEWVEAAKA